MTELDETYTFLQQIRRKETEIRRKQLQYDELKSCLLPEAIRYDVDRVQSSAEDPMGRIFSELDDLERQIAELKAEKAGLISLVAGAIEQLEDDFEKTVLAEFYIGRMWRRRSAIARDGRTTSESREFSISVHCWKQSRRTLQTEMC